MDKLTKEQRSRLMSRIKSKGTTPEKLMRTAFRRLGLSFRINDPGLPGKPDIVFPQRKAAVFVHGCFWHVHGCEDSRWPRTNVGYWFKKLTGNMSKDFFAMLDLKKMGWRCFVAWECEIRKDADAVAREIFQKL